MTAETPDPHMLDEIVYEESLLGAGEIPAWWKHGTVFDIDAEGMGLVPVRVEEFQTTDFDTPTAELGAWCSDEEERAWFVAYDGRADLHESGSTVHCGLGRVRQWSMRVSQ